MHFNTKDPEWLNNLGLKNPGLKYPATINEAFEMDNESFEAIIGDEKPNADEPVIFFCVKGIRAQSAADLVKDKFKYKESLFYPGPFTHLQ